MGCGSRKGGSQGIWGSVVLCFVEILLSFGKWEGLVLPQKGYLFSSFTYFLSLTQLSLSLSLLTRDSRIVLGG